MKVVFQGLYFKPKKVQGQYVLALRGTLQTGSDLAITDVGDIVYDGLAHHQIVDLYNL